MPLQTLGRDTYEAGLRGSVGETPPVSGSRRGWYPSIRRNRCPATAAPADRVGIQQACVAPGTVRVIYAELFNPQDNVDAPSGGSPPTSARRLGVIGQNTDARSNVCTNGKGAWPTAGIMTQTATPAAKEEEPGIAAKREKSWHCSL